MLTLCDGHGGDEAARIASVRAVEFVEQALSLGADDYWVKGTFSMDTLEQWLTYYLVDGKR